MFIVRDTFTAKPGQASKLAALFKDVISELMDKEVRVITDAFGSFNTVEMEFEVEDLGEFERMMKEYGSRPEFRERMAGYTEMYQTGSRTAWRVM